MQWEERHRHTRACTHTHTHTHARTHAHTHARTHARFLISLHIYWFRIKKLFVKNQRYTDRANWRCSSSLPQYKWITDSDCLIDWFWLNWLHNKCTILCKTVQKHKLNLGNMTQSVSCSRRQGLDSTKKCLLREKALCQHLFKIMACPLR